MDFLPIFADIKGQTCVVVGGGEVAARKASMLVRAGARIRLVAGEVSPACVAIVEKSAGEIRQRAFCDADLEGSVLVVAATDDLRVNAHVSDAARRLNMLVNVVDQPDLCSFVFPSIVDRSPVVVAVSSGGSSPVLARLIRGKLETLIPASYGRLAALVGKFRAQAKERYPDVNVRRGFWEKVLSGPISEMVFSGRELQAREALEAALDPALSETTGRTGEVYLVGAGPGDPDLLTFRALRLMQQADVVLYDRLVSDGVLDLVRRDAERINVGKARSDHTMPQQDINQLLVTLARQGKRVCRLKGGDPFIFGRGGEEIEKLAEEGIPFQVVPGITAASGCSSYAGIPLTHRDYSQSVRFVTGHLKDGAPDLDWQLLAAERQTLVFYMGLVGLPRICEQLQVHGLPGSTPVALVQQGTTRNQQVIIGTLGTINELIASRKVKAPTLTIVGDVVRLHDKLKWFSPGEV